MKNSHGKIGKLKKGIGKGEFKGLVVGRSESRQEIETRIDRLDNEFRKKESSGEIHELERDGGSKFRGIGRNLAGW